MRIPMLPLPLYFLLGQVRWTACSHLDWRVVSGIVRCVFLLACLLLFFRVAVVSFFECYSHVLIFRVSFFVFLSFLLVVPSCVCSHPAASLNIRKVYLPFFYFDYLPHPLLLDAHLPCFIPLVLGHSLLSPIVHLGVLALSSYTRSHHAHRR